MSDEFTHLDAEGRVRMVDVTDKTPTVREATACGRITMTGDTLDRIGRKNVKKGNVLETARIAGIMAAKKTAELIPMCHPLAITHVQVDFDLLPDEKAIGITALVRLKGSTGVEMEALTAVAVAALTIYDMCKSYDREMIIGSIHLAEKSGGKSGHYRRPAKSSHGR
ncbi:MAG: cyclic pyranopterin monophosphate synthase MoaC [Pseudomonadota bacterium]